MIKLAENEKWIPGMEGDYSADTSGEIYSYKRGYKKQMKGGVTYRIIRKEKRAMYRMICFTGENGQFNEYVHRLIGKTFLDNFREDWTINHLNGDKTDNRPENLECVSASDNSKHAWETGLVTSESLRLTEEEVMRRSNEFCVGKMEGTVDFYRKYIDPKYLKKFGLPVECLNFSFPLGRFNNMVEYWKYTVSMFKDMESGSSLGEMKKKYGIDPSALSRIRAKERRQAEWKAYERVKKSLYEKLNLENS